MGDCQQINLNANLVNDDRFYLNQIFNVLDRNQSIARYDIEWGIGKRQLGKGPIIVTNKSVFDIPNFSQRRYISVHLTFFPKEFRKGQGHITFDFGRGIKQNFYFFVCGNILCCGRSNNPMYFRGVRNCRLVSELLTSSNQIINPIQNVNTRDTITLIDRLERFDTGRLRAIVFYFLKIWTDVWNTINPNLRVNNQPVTLSKCETNHLPYNELNTDIEEERRRRIMAENQLNNEGADNKTINELIQNPAQVEADLAQLQNMGIQELRNIWINKFYRLRNLENKLNSRMDILRRAPDILNQQQTTEIRNSYTQVKRQIQERKNAIAGYIQSLDQYNSNTPVINGCIRTPASDGTITWLRVFDGSFASTNSLETVPNICKSEAQRRQEETAATQQRQQQERGRGEEERSGRRRDRSRSPGSRNRSRSRSRESSSSYPEFEEIRQYHWYPEIDSNNWTRRVFRDGGRVFLFDRNNPDEKWYVNGISEFENMRTGEISHQPPWELPRIGEFSSSSSANYEREFQQYVSQ